MPSENHAVDAAAQFDAAIELIRPHHASIFWGDRMLTIDKAAGFRQDPKFKEAIRTADSSTGQNQYASPDGIGWRYNTLIWAARQALLIEGHFVECGVYQGDMSWVVTEMVDLPSRCRTMYLYDTFSGFSDKYTSVADFPDSPQFLQIAQAEYAREGIYEAVVKRFSTKSYVEVIRGVVPDVLNGTAPEKIAFLHLDMNSPGPEQGALEFLFDRITPGGLIIFDDYGWAIFDKQKQSADEFMVSRGLTVLELPTGQGLAIKPVR
jgi:O-methyltransferase